MSDLQTDTLRQGAFERIARARQAAPSAHAIGDVADITERFFADLSLLHGTLNDINADARLSDEGQREKRAAALEAWERTSGELADEITARVERATHTDPAKVTPRPPVDDPAVLEGRLANARSDAQMLLGNVDLGRLADRMQELAQHAGDPALTYLLVATPYGEHLIRSRLPADPRAGGREALLAWDATRRSLAREMLDDAGRAALDRAEALRPLSQVPILVTHARETVLRERRG